MRPGKRTLWLFPVAEAKGEASPLTGWQVSNGLGPGEPSRYRDSSLRRFHGNGRGCTHGFGTRRDPMAMDQS